MRAYARVALAGCLAAVALGCAPVQPWERDVLARPDMAWEPNPTRATLDAHIFFSKEASLEGGSAGGGGCGCN